MTVNKDGTACTYLVTTTYYDANGVLHYDTYSKTGAWYNDYCLPSSSVKGPAGNGGQFGGGLDTLNGGALQPMPLTTFLPEPISVY